MSVPAVGQLALQEFRGYLELCKDSSTRLKENDAADSQEQMLEVRPQITSANCPLLPVAILKIFMWTCLVASAALQDAAISKSVL